MQPSRINAFFSCSFQPQDSDVNELFSSICTALAIDVTNVDCSSANTPPEVAKKKIDECQILIAVCLKRDKLEGGGYIMPQAVHDEISFAFGKDIPVLMFVENGVELKGFKQNFGSYLAFDRQHVFSPEFIGKIVRSINELKLQVLGPNEIGMSHGISESHAEFVNHLVELRWNGSDFEWEYNTTKKLVYLAASKRSFPLSAWATVPGIVPEDAKPIQWSIKLSSSSNGIKLVPIVEKQTPICVEAIVKLEPPAEAGDFIEYSTTISSRYVNPVWLDEATDGVSVHLDDGDYICADGIILIHRTKKAIVEFRIAREYGLKKGDYRPFVGSYTSTVDYEVPSELKRSVVRVEEFAGTVVVRFEVESPLPGHMYGIAWNPPKRPGSSLPKIL
jgi:hypothetical protein